MNNSLQLDEFKQQIAAMYDLRQDTYDLGGENNWHLKLAHHLVEYADIQQGDKVLDLATGTGMVALAAAKLVGSSGYVLGVDISRGLLQQAQYKINAAGLNNIELRLADVEKLNLPDRSFNKILCCSALPLLTDVPADLRLWRRFLVPGGKLGLCVFAETAFTAGVVLQKIARKYGVNLIFSNLTGTEAKFRSLLKTAGFKNIQIETAQYDNYISLESAIKTWNGGLKHPLCYPLLQLNSQQLKQVKAEYIAEIEALPFSLLPNNHKN